MCYLFLPCLLLQFHSTTTHQILCYLLLHINSVQCWIIHTLIRLRDHWHHFFHISFYTLRSFFLSFFSRYFVSSSLVHIGIVFFIPSHSIWYWNHLLERACVLLLGGTLSVSCVKSCGCLPIEQCVSTHLHTFSLDAYNLIFTYYISRVVMSSFSSAACCWQFRFWLT